MKNWKTLILEYQFGLNYLTQKVFRNYLLNKILM